MKFAKVKTKKSRVYETLNHDNFIMKVGIFGTHHALFVMIEGFINSILFCHRF
jgi:hypothetical protein